jgi:hypothetical protein
MVEADPMKKQPQRRRKPERVTDYRQGRSLSSLRDLNRSLRQQAVDLVLSIAVMKERAGPSSGAHLPDMNSADVMGTDFGSVFRSPGCPDPANGAIGTPPQGD